MVDYLIVGAGLAGATCARDLADAGKSVLVLEKRDHPAGMAATEVIDGITCQQHGGHIFHTNDRAIWEYVNRFGEWRNYRHRVKVRSNGTVYSFPINLMTMQQVWGAITPEQAEAYLVQARIKCDGANLRDWALAQVGPVLYRLFIEGYTRKQWGKDPAELPAAILKRIPVRLTWNDDYFDDEYQGLPKDGYTSLVENMLTHKNIVVEYGTDYTEKITYWNGRARRVIYTGALDLLLGCQFGRLEYRSLRFEHERVEAPDYQGISAINYADASVPYTRILEHKHWYPAKAAHTIITREYPAAFTGDNEPYYPLNDERNDDLYQAYRRMAEARGLLLCGRMAIFRYLDMHQVIGAARQLVRRETQ